MATVPCVEARVWFAPPRDEDRFLPEGPRAAGPGVLWVNIQTAPDATAGDVFLRPWGEPLRSFRMPGRPGFAIPTDRPGVALVGCEKTVGLYDFTSNQWEPLATIPDDNPRTIINDGEVLPGGRAVVFGTKDVRFADPIAQLFLFTLDDHRLTVLADGQTCSNGKVFAAEPGGLVLYDIDTPRRLVVRYRLDLQYRTLEDQGVAIDLRDEPGFPDGMAGCGDGTVVVAFYNPDPVPAGRAVRYRLGTGEVVEEWATPGSPRVTCPLLFERDGRVQLLLTTATEGMPAEQRGRCPNAGCLFVADTGLETIPAPEIVRLTPP